MRCYRNNTKSGVEIMNEKQIQEVMALVDMFAQAASVWPMSASPQKLSECRAAIERALREQVRGVPEGWKLVPVEPTEDMFVDGMEADCLGRQSIDDESHVRSIWAAMLSAAPTQPAQAEQPQTATGNIDVDKVIDRLMSSDPDFQDCAEAAALIQREIKGPNGFATWKEAAIAERLRRVQAERTKLENFEQVLIEWDAAHRIAYQAAAAFRPSYFKGSGFTAHNWVVEAIRSAHLDGQRFANGLPPIDRTYAERQVAHEKQPKAAQQEPVAQWQKRHPLRTDGKWENTNEHDAKWWRDNSMGWEIRALYTAAAPQREPMTFRELADATTEFAHVRSDYMIGIARAVERFHRITKKEQA